MSRHETITVQESLGKVAQKSELFSDPSRVIAAWLGYPSLTDPHKLSLSISPNRFNHHPIFLLFNRDFFIEWWRK